VAVGENGKVEEVWLGRFTTRVSEIGSEVPVGSSRRAKPQQRTQVIALTRFNLFQALGQIFIQRRNNDANYQQKQSSLSAVHLCRREHAGRVS